MEEDGMTALTLEMTWQRTHRKRRGRARSQRPSGRSKLSHPRTVTSKFQPAEEASQWMEKSLHT
eukprot:3383449-Amphidinium_carterae.1